MTQSDESNRTLLNNKWKYAINRASKLLKKGDRFRASRCGGFSATYSFLRWDGNWIVTKSGIDNISADSISKINGVPFFPYDGYKP